MYLECCTIWAVLSLCDTFVYFFCHVSTPTLIQRYKYCQAFIVTLWQKQVILVAVLKLAEIEKWVEAQSNALREGLERSQVQAPRIQSILIFIITSGGEDKRGSKRRSFFKEV